MDRPGIVTPEPGRSLEPVESPEPRTLPDPETNGDGDRGYEPIHPRSTLRELVRKLGAGIVGLGLLLLKFGGLLLKLKVLTTAGSMLVSIAAYAWIWGWQFAVGFVLLIFV